VAAAGLNSSGLTAACSTKPVDQSQRSVWFGMYEVQIGGTLKAGRASRVVIDSGKVRLGPINERAGSLHLHRYVIHKSEGWNGSRNGHFAN
jgi:hypothetical protein